MNSFMQALYMTKDFRYKILSIDITFTLNKDDNQMQIEQSNKKTIINNANNTKIQEIKVDDDELQNVGPVVLAELPVSPQLPIEQNKIIEKKSLEQAQIANRKRVLVFFQLQKLFAYLLQSERDSIPPNFFKASLPDDFKNSHAQQDSSEFGKIYLDYLEKSLVNTPERVKFIFLSI